MSRIAPARSDSGRYSSASVVLHWLMLLLLVGAYAAMELREIYPKGSEPREAMKMWHFMLGLTVFGLVWLRIVARLLWPAPFPVTGPALPRIAAGTMHILLYAFMIAMPLAGWMILSADGNAIPFFGLELPALTVENPQLAERVEGLHKLGGTIGYWLIAAHAAAALFHHYVLRDRLLARMLPIRA